MKTMAAMSFLSSSILRLNPSNRSLSKRYKPLSHFTTKASFLIPFHNHNFSRNDLSNHPKGKHTAVSSAATNRMAAASVAEESRVPPAVPLPTPPLTKASLDPSSLSLSLHTQTHVSCIVKYRCVWTLIIY